MHDALLIKGNRPVWEDLVQYLEGLDSILLFGDTPGFPRYPSFLDFSGRFIEALPASEQASARDQFNKSLAFHLHQALAALASHSSWDQVFKAIQLAYGFPPAQIHPVKATKTHHLIADLPFLGHLTSTYDRGLSTAFKSRGEIATDITRRNGLAFDWPDRRGRDRTLPPEILHLCGLLPDLGSIAEQHRLYPPSSSLARKVWDNLLDLWKHLSWVVLTAGCFDPWPLQIAQRLQQDSPPYTRVTGRHFMLFPWQEDSDPTEQNRAYFVTAFGSQVLFYPATTMQECSEALDEILLALAMELCDDSPSPQAPPEPHLKPVPGLLSRDNRDRPVFRKNGEFWIVSFKEDHLSLRESKGLKAIHAMLREPRRDFRPIDLERIIEPALHPTPLDQSEIHAHGMSEVSTDLTEPLIDRQTQEACAARLRELNELIENARQIHDKSQLEELSLEREQLLEYLASSTGIHGRPRYQKTEARRARDRMNQAIKRTLRKLEREAPVLHAHLELTIRRGQSHWSYTPEEELDWAC